MMRSATAVGIDVAEARKGLDLVALDCDGSLVAGRRRMTLDDVVGGGVPAVSRRRSDRHRG